MRMTTSYKRPAEHAAERCRLLVNGTWHDPAYARRHRGVGCSLWTELPDGQTLDQVPNWRNVLPGAANGSGASADAHPQHLYMNIFRYLQQCSRTLCNLSVIRSEDMAVGVTICFRHSHRCDLPAGVRTAMLQQPGVYSCLSCPPSRERTQSCRRLKQGSAPKAGKIAPMCQQQAGHQYLST